MDNRESIRDEVHLLDNKKREVMKKKYDARVKEVRFVPEDFVMLWDISKKRKRIQAFT